MNRRLRNLLSAALVVAGAVPAAAQSRLAVTIEPGAAASQREAPVLTLANVFADARSVELLASGFPARITVSTELWQSRRWFDELLRSAAYQYVIQFDPLTKTYQAARIERAVLTPEGPFATIDDVRQRIAAPQHPPLPPPRGAKDLYYTAHVTIEILNSNDLAEVQRWLRGDVQPALRGEGDPGSALTRGVRTLVSRLLGGDVKRAEAQSARFDN